MFNSNSFASPEDHPKKIEMVYCTAEGDFISQTSPKKVRTLLLSSSVFMCADERIPTPLGDYIFE